jgi:hypothetical protein
MADDGPLRLSLFDQQDLAEITSPDFPGERLIACRNPLLAAERARKRENLLAATEEDLAKVAAQAAAGRIKGADKIGVRAGRVVNKHKMAKHLILDITDSHLAWRRDQAAIALAPLTYTDEQPPARDNPVAPACRSLYAGCAAGLVDGNRHDSAALEVSGVLHGLDPADWIGDKGYIGNGMLTPIRKPPHRSLLDWEKEFTRRWAGFATRSSRPSPT